MIIIYKGIKGNKKKLTFLTENSVREGKCKIIIFFFFLWLFFNYFVIIISNYPGFFSTMITIIDILDSKLLLSPEFIYIYNKKKYILKLGKVSWLFKLFMVNDNIKNYTVSVNIFIFLQFAHKRSSDFNLCKMSCMQKWILRINFA